MNVCLRLLGRRLRRAVGAMLCMTAMAGVGSRAAETAERTLTTLGEFYSVPPDEGTKRFPFRFDLDLQFLDPDWKLLWLTDRETYSYVTPGPELVHLRSGQRVRFEGTIVPADGLKLDQAKLTVLAEQDPVPPLDTRGRLADIARFNSRNVVVEALIEQEYETDATHLLLEMVAEGRRLTGRVLLRPTDPIPQFAGRWASITGLYVSAGEANRDGAINLWIPSADDVRPLRRLTEDPAFDAREVALDALGTVSPGETVRVTGEVVADDSGAAGVAVRGPAGQVLVRTPQRRFTQPGTLVEAIGRPRLDGVRWLLDDGLIRPSRRSDRPVGETEGGLPRLRLAAQILDLGAKEAERSYPVHLTGVALWWNASQRRLFLDDGSRGIEVRMPLVADIPVPPFGVTIVGHTTSGAFAPIVDATSLKKTVGLLFPPARKTDLDQLLAGNEHARWVELEGFVRETTRIGDQTRLAITTPTGEFDAWISGTEAPAALEGAVVGVRGVCDVLTNERRQLTGVQLLVPSFEHVTVLASAPAAIFDVPESSIAALRQFGHVRALHARTRAAGTVLYHDAGRLLILQDGEDSLHVLSRDRQRLPIGARVEVVGFPGREGPRVVLREANYRRSGAEKPVTPQPLNSLDPLDESLDGRLVQVRARILDVAGTEQSTLLTVQNGRRTYTVLGPTELAGAVPQLGSVVDLTAVYRVGYDEFRRPRDVQLLARQARDFTLVESPAWWTAERALGAVGVLALLVAGVGAWVVALRRQVARQTAQLREQMERQLVLEAELERANRLQSLGVLAGGIAHDFNNLLTVIMGNLTLAQLDDDVAARAGTELREAEKGAIRARDLTQQLLTFAKGGDPVREAVNPAELLREAVEFAMHGSKCRAEVKIAPDVRPVYADRAQLARLVHNLATHCQGAMPGGGTIHFELENTLVETESGRPFAPGRYVRLVVRDHGKGFTEQELPRVFDPYYGGKAIGGLGLATVYSIARKHGGHAEVSSAPDTGSEFRIWLPAANAPEEDARPHGRAAAPPRAEGPRGAAEGTGAPVSRAAAAKPARILVLDDEDGIRLLVTSVLRRQGYDLQEAAEGRACVDEYRAAQQAGRPFDLLIMDLTIPGGMGGQEALAEIRLLDPDACAIVSSGYAQDPVIANYREYGFAALVKKPYDIRLLRETVQRLLAERGAVR